jgi:hypothetical protein
MIKINIKGLAQKWLMGAQVAGGGAVRALVWGGGGMRVKKCLKFLGEIAHNI